MKLLIVSHTYPPNPGVGGRRIEGLKKYLEKLGHEVFLVVNEIHFIEDKTNIEEDSFIIRTGNPPILKSKKQKTSSNVLEYLKSTKFVKMLKEFYFLPDKEIKWFDYGYAAATKVIKEENIDILITSSLPHVVQFIGAKLKKEHPYLKWVVELRDLWSKNHYSSNNFLLKKINAIYEYKTIKKSDAIVTVSEPLVNELKITYPNKILECITNGFDSDKTFNVELDKAFTITYTGILYEGLRDPRLFLTLIDEMIEDKYLDKEKIRINFFGPKELWLQDFILKNRMEECVKQNGLVNHKVAIKKQCSSQLLLFINSNKKKDVGVYTAKIFEYLNSRRPIIAIGNCSGVVEELLNYTNTGFYKPEINDLKKIIIEVYNEFLTKGEVDFRGFNNRINEYSFEGMAKKYLKLIENL